MIILFLVGLFLGVSLSATASSRSYNYDIARTKQVLMLQFLGMRLFICLF